MDSWREGRRVVEPDEDADIKELIFRYAELLHEVPLGGILKGWVWRSQIKGGNQLVHARVKEGIGWSKNRMDIRFSMTLEVYQLFKKSIAIGDG